MSPVDVPHQTLILLLAMFLRPLEAWSVLCWNGAKIWHACRASLLSRSEQAELSSLCWLLEFALS